METDAATIYKILLPMRRRPGMTTEAFRDYYENHHVPLALKYSRGLLRYVRRYLDPHPHPEIGAAAEPPFDVITELWFDDEQTFRRTLAFLTTSALPEEVVADERALFDRSSFCILTALECVTDREAIQAGDGAAQGKSPTP